MSLRTFLLSNQSPTASYPAAWPIVALGQAQSITGEAGLVDAWTNGIKWVNRFYYDQDRGRAFMLTKRAGGLAFTYSSVLYQASNNTWTHYEGPGSSSDESGHVYESIAYDPATGRLYNGNYGGDTVKAKDLETSLVSWINPVTAAYSEPFTNDIQPAMAWHPNLFGVGDGGLVVQKGNWGDPTGILLAWRKGGSAPNTWSEIPGVSWSGNIGGGGPAYNGAVVYCKAGDFCVFSCPAQAGNLAWRIPAGSGGNLATAVQIQNAPMQVGYSDTGVTGGLYDSPKDADPHMYLIQKGGSSVWKCDGSTWSPAGSHPLSYPDNYFILASCQPHGVFMVRGFYASTPTQIWRPSS